MRKAAGAGSLISLLGIPGALLAHPHVFIDAALEVLFDDEGRAEALRVSWTYDDLYSLTVISDMGLDPDFDGALTETERAKLSGFDMQWDASFPGDTYPLLGDADLALSRPSDWSANYTAGRITSVHLRRFVAPVAIGNTDLVVQIYDPSFYTAYSIVGLPKLKGRTDCSVEVFEPDRTTADAMLQAAIDELAGSSGVEGDFPAIGKAYSEEARVSCTAP